MEQAVKWISWSPNFLLESNNFSLIANTRIFSEDKFMYAYIKHTWVAFLNNFLLLELE